MTDRRVHMQDSGMQVSRIEQKIEDIYAFVESCKMQPLSTTKVVVPKNELYDLLDDLRRDMPEEIRRYQKILSQRDAILEDAENKANTILLDAREQYKGMVEEHSIMQQASQQAALMVQQAKEQAEEIIASAQRQALEIGNSAIEYTNEMLTMAEKAITDAGESVINNSNALAAALSGHLDIIRKNKAELIPAEAADAGRQEYEPQDDSELEEPEDIQ